MRKTYVTLMGGLGNQLFQYAAALSTESERIVLVTEIGKPRITDGIEDIFGYEIQSDVQRLEVKHANRILRKLFNLVLKLNLMPVTSRFTLIGIGLVNIWFSNILSVWLKEKISFLPGKGIGYTPIPKMTGISIYLHGYFQSSEYLNQESILNRMKLLSLQPSPNWLIEYTNTAREHNPIVVHVRRGDYRSESNFGLLGIDYYREALDYLSELMEINKIWLFSDEPEFARTLIPDEYQARVEVIPEFDTHPAATLELMRLGSGYVIANSSFSWWAAILSKSDNARIVAPSAWFKNQASPEKLLPNHWKTVKPHFE